jgi:capsular polysaccharide biosynthesis protein
MELAYIFKTLTERKLALAVTTVLALALAIVSGYSVSSSGLKPRSSQYGAASQQVLIDSPQSALVDLKKDTVPLAVRALVYAQFMRSGAIVDPIAQRLGISPAQVTTQGPFSADGAGQATPQPAVSRSNQLAAERDQYRLAFDAQENLPVVTIYAQAPSEAKAIALANASVSSLQQYVATLQTKQQLKDSDRVLIRSLGGPSAGTVNHGSSPVMMVLIFFVVIGFGCALILAYVSLRRGMRQLSTDERGGRSDDDEFSPSWAQNDGPPTLAVAPLTVSGDPSHSSERQREPSV